MDSDASTVAIDAILLQLITTAPQVRLQSPVGTSAGVAAASVVVEGQHQLVPILGLTFPSICLLSP